MRLQYIDGMKGLGAFMVFFCHYNGLLHMVELPRYLLFFGNGEFAVVLFLMLSGFSVTMSFEKHNTQMKIRRTILNRYFRFAIPMAVAVTLSYLFYLFGFYHNHDVAMLAGTHYGNLFQNVSLKSYILSLFYSPLSYNVLIPPLWMVKYIFLGTFGLIILFLGCQNMKFTTRAIVLFFFMMLLAKESKYYISIILGMMLFYANKEFNFAASCKRFKIIPFVLITASYVIGCLFGRVGKLDSVMLIMGAFLLIVGGIISPSIQKLFLLLPLKILGSLSFEIYLFHIIVVCSFSCIMWLSFHSCSVFSDLIIFILTIVLVILLSWIMRNLIVLLDKQFQQRIINKLAN